MRRPITAALLGLALVTPAAAQEGMTEDRVRELVRETLLENPQIIAEAIETLRAEQIAAQEQATADVIAANRDRLTGGSDAVVLGNPEGDVTVVEFFDYNCGYCRRAAPVVDDLIAADDGIRVVAREFPILSEGSVVAARAALAAREQGLYREAHDALMALEGQADETSVMTAMQGLDLDMERLAADMGSEVVESHLATSMALSQELEISGTPTFVIGDQLIPGYVELGQLQALVDDVRASEGG